jgi:AraC-like DNA-binding protein
MGSTERVRSWRPAVPGVAEVLHAHFTEHAYPSHTHAEWTLLLVDTGGVDYALGRTAQRAEPRSLTLLPPHVPHDGRAAREGGFDKRVVYVDERWLPLDLVGAAERAPSLAGADLVAEAAAVHEVLACPGDELEAESRLALVCERIVDRLDRRRAPEARRVPGLARQVRERLDAADGQAPTVQQMALDLDVHPTAVVRAFTREFAMPPHRYLVGRRLDRARRLLLEGMAPADVAVEAGFHDQPHLTRHFRRLLGVTPGAFARGAAPSPAR